MSYRLIDANALAMKCKEVNDMPCIYADLPNGLDDGYYDLARAERTCHADEVTHRNCKYSINRGWRERTCHITNRHGDWYCESCGELVGTFDTTSELYIDGNAIELWDYCPRCGAKVVGE